LNALKFSARGPAASGGARQSDARTARMIEPANVHLKRAYEPPSPADGVRVLVDRLWPRGVSKSKAAIERWMKEIAPSTELRRWFGHDPKRWKEFLRRYRAELKYHAEALSELRAIARKGPLTLIYAARDKNHNEAVVLREILLRSPHARQIDA
jgi:uncharacterized protein YeaO (DUF488 family)